MVPHAFTQGPKTGLFDWDFYEDCFPLNPVSSANVIILSNSALFAIKSGALIFSKAPLHVLKGCGILSAVFRNGEVAQLVEHHVRNVRVGGSNPLFSTIFRNAFRPIISRSIHGRDAFCVSANCEQLRRLPCDTLSP